MTTKDYIYLGMILLTALAFNALGESMRVALDPTMKRR